MACPRCDRSVLRPRQFSSGSDSDLRADEIYARHLFGHRVLDLEPRVHLEKVEASGFAGSFDEKLHRPGVSIARLARDGHRCVTHPLPQRRSDHRRWTLLDHLLVTSLNRTLALEQMDDVAVVIGEDLELDMSRLLDQPFNVERAVAEGRHCFASCLRDCFGEIADRCAPFSSRCRRHPLMASATRGSRRDARHRQSHRPIGPSASRPEQPARLPRRRSGVRRSSTPFPRLLQLVAR